MRLILSTLLFLALAVPAYAGGTIEGTVSLSPKLKSQVSENDTVFVFAQAQRGPKMPLAILQARVKDLPLKFKLTDEMAMMPRMKMSNFLSVNIVGRVSKTGQAMAQKGDLEGLVPGVQLNSSKVKIIIDKIL